MKTLYTLLIAMLALLAGPARAGGEDLDNCRWANGSAIRSDVCNYLRKAAAQDAAREQDRQRLAEAQAARREEQRLADIKAAEEREEQRIAAQAAAEEAKRVEAAARAKRDAEFKAQFDREERERKAAADAERREIAREESRYASFIAKKKAECGDDFQRPRIGMSLERAQQCVGTMKLQSQTNRSDGVVSTYRVGPLWVMVMGGRIVHWSR